MPDTNYAIKSTISVKQRTEVGDELFISVGMEAIGVAAENLDTEQAALDERLKNWLESRVAEAGASVFAGGGDDEVGEEEAAGDEEAADDEEAVTPDDVAGMDKKALDALIDEYELEVDKKLKLADKRAAIIEALFDESEEGEGDEEEAEGEGEGDEEEFTPYTEEELGAMKLAELQEIAKEWDLTVKTKPNADLKAKKAATIKAIVAAQEAAAEEE